MHESLWITHGMAFKMHVHNMHACMHAQACLYNLHSRLGTIMHACRLGDECMELVMAVRRGDSSMDRLSMSGIKCGNFSV